jgi:hypothetical protein
MGLSAFNARTEVRDAALQRLAAHVEVQQLLSGALLWDGEKGSVAGCLAESSDPAEWEARLGLARWMAYALDTVTGRLGATRALSEAEALLRAIPVGHDTGAMGSLLIIRLLDEVVAVRAPIGALADALDALFALHRRCLQNEEVIASEWKAARRAAMQASDALVPPPAEDERLAPDAAQLRAVGGAIEAAAWDPQRSATAVSEVLRQWLVLEGLNADEEFGWTPEDDALIRQRLGEMHAKYLADKPDETRTVFDFLEIEHDALATRLRAYIKHGGEHGVVCCERACAMLRRLLETAS